jgi:sec-independent protein translocase protein TatA
MPGIGFPELVVILVIALLVLGPKKLPEAGRAMGKGIREFKDSVSEITPGRETAGEPDSAPARSASELS